MQSIWSPFSYLTQNSCTASAITLERAHQKVSSVIIMLPGCIKHTPVNSDEMPAESNRCPATGRERSAICVPRTAAQTLYLKEERREQGEKPSVDSLCVPWLR